MSSAAIRGFARLADVPEEQVTPLIRRRIVTGDKEMLVFWSAKAGGHAAAHRHPHEQIFFMLSGRMKFRIGDEVRVCGPGELCVIPGGVEHEAWWLEDTEVLDVFAPPREDFLSGGPPTYMRRD
jgi:quercetin dioxygenase-like cupin family protein